jgi:hypothetical protein
MKDISSIEELIFKTYSIKIENNNLKKDELICSLCELETHLEKQYPIENNHEVELSNKAIFLLRNFNEDEIIDYGYGIDYTLELIDRKPIISKKTHPLLYNLICLPKEKKKGVIKENNGMGYHIHYVVVENKKECRTNIVFTLNPKISGNHANPKLYWERHGQGLEKYPEKFKNRRKHAIYDTSCSFLRNIPIKEFRAPKVSSHILWPVM